MKRDGTPRRGGPRGLHYRGEGGEAKMDYKLKLPPDMIIHFCTFHIDLMEFSC